MQWHVGVWLVRQIVEKVAGWKVSRAAIAISIVFASSDINSIVIYLYTLWLMSGVPDSFSGVVRHD
jgi:hypothetical protein